jgi:hypothetical protein
MVQGEGFKVNGSGVMVLGSSFMVASIRRCTARI